MKRTYQYQLISASSYIFNALATLSILLIIYFVSTLNSMSGLGNFGNLVTFIFIFHAGLAGVLITGIAGIVYYNKKEKSKAVLALAIKDIVVPVISFITLGYLFGFSGWDSSSNMALSAILFVISLVCTAVVYHAMNQSVIISQLEPMLPMRGFDESANIVEEADSNTKAASITFASIKATCLSKTGKMVIAVLGAFLVIIGAYSFWNANFNFKAVDLFQDLNVSYSGRSGEGYANFYAGDTVWEELYEIDPDLGYALYEIDFVIREEDGIEDGRLSNGDKIIVRIEETELAEEMFKESKVKLKKTEMEMTVEGLTEVYKSIEDMDKDDLQDDLDAIVKGFTLDDYFEAGEYEFLNAYYLVEQDSDLPDAKLVLVYEYTYVDTDWFTDEETIEKEIVTIDVYYDSEFDDDYINIYQDNVYAEDYDYATVENYEEYLADHFGFDEDEVIIEKIDY